MAMRKLATLSLVLLFIFLPFSTSAPQETSPGSRSQQQSSEAVEHCPQTSYYLPRYDQTSDYIRVKQPIRQLNEFTICGWFTTPSSGKTNIIVSYATTTKTNALITKFSLTSVMVWTNNGQVPSVSFPAVKSGEGLHMCVATHAGSSGLTSVYLNGELRDITHGTPGVIGEGGIFIIGQEQDEMGGKFDSKDCYKGQITNFMMWERILCEQEIKRMYASKCYCAPGYALALTRDNVQLYGAASAINVDSCPAA